MSDRAQKTPASFPAGSWVVGRPGNMPVRTISCAALNARRNGFIERRITEEAAKPINGDISYEDTKGS